MPNKVKRTPKGPDKRHLAVLALALMAWTPSVLTDRWTADDPEVVLQNPVVSGSLPATTAFARDYTFHVGESGQWRPAAALSLRLDHSLFGPNSSRGWHITNLLFHLAAVWLAMSLAQKAYGNMFTLGLCVYAVHPILTDSVAWVSGRPSLVCVALGLMGAHLLHEVLSRSKSPTAWASIAALALLLPLLAKEDGVLFSLLLLSIGAKQGRSPFLWSLFGCGIAVSLWLVARHWALGAAIPAATEPLLLGVPVLDRLGTGFRAIAEGSRLLWTPINRPPSYELNSLPSGLYACGLLLPVFLTLYAAAKRKWFSLAALLLPLMALVPFLQVFPMGEAFAPRFLHIPLLLSVPLLHGLVSRLPKTLAPVVITVLVAITWVNTKTYEDAEAYWLASLRHNASSPVAWNALGLARADQDRHGDAIASFKEALKRDPSHSRAWSNLARSLAATGDKGGSVDALRAAVRSGPRNPIAHTNWGLHLERSGSDHDARASFLKAVELRPGLSKAWDGLARTARRLGYENQAKAAEQRSLSLNPR